MTNTVDYKSTILLPKTDFPMKGNLPIKEPEMIKQWEEKKIYQKIQKKNAGKKKFVLPDGPPYANGSIHIGHALNKTLKDIIIKYKNMTGFQSAFIPGWDCHGLPIEHAVMKNLGSKAREKTDAEIRTLCRAEAQKWIDHQRPQFIRLGILADWENPYLTMNADYEAEEVREFARAYQKGVVYLGTKPVYWNWTLQTALADAEVEYHNHKSPSIFVKFPIEDVATLAKLGNPKNPTYVVIWTTTPWTLPSNLGVCLNADFEYALYNNGSENLFFAKDLKESVEKDCGLSLSIEKTIIGAELDKMKARHPFIDRDSLFCLGDHVTKDAGTGCVHTAPGHGMDDYKVGLKYGMEILSPINDAGQYTHQVPEFEGQNIFKANPLIVEKLKNLGVLLAYKEIEHSYPHCWRSKTPLIFRATPQWFIGLDLENSNIRRKTLKAIDEIKFFPNWGEARLKAMMEGRPDWCLSRQRIWGVPIPVFYCVKTSTPVADYNVMLKVADVIEKEGGIDAFHKHPASHFLTGYKAPVDAPPGFGSEGFKQGRDILDVWFDSGICHTAVQKKREGMAFPADIYLEGSDQHRGWFNTSLLSSIAVYDQAPFKALITHGFVMDSQGLKMSKSKGNVIDPQEVAKQSGMEILRLWTAYEDYGQDLSCGKNELERVTETYRKIRNTMKYMLGVPFDFDKSKDQVAYNQMTEIDQWILARLYDLNKKITAAYEEYAFYKVYHLLNNFFTVDLSANYLDVVKDRLYTWKQNGLPRRSTQTAVSLITDYLIRMMAPILSFLAEEAYSYTSGTKEDSVLLLDFPKAPEDWNKEAVLQRFEEHFKVRTDVQKALEELRAQKIIGASLEAIVQISADEKIKARLDQFSGLREFLIVSEVEVTSGNYGIKVAKMEGEKCVRCWIYSKEISKDAKFAGICPKCVEALS